jgi:hypothetical protein
LFFGGEKNWTKQGQCTEALVSEPPSSRHCPGSLDTGSLDKGCRSNQHYQPPRVRTNRLRILAMEGIAGPFSFNFGNFHAQCIGVGTRYVKQTHSLRFTGLSQLHPDSRMKLEKPVAHRTKIAQPQN